MIYMEPHQLGWKPLKDSYMNTLPPALQDVHRELVRESLVWCLSYHLLRKEMGLGRNIKRQWCSLVSNGSRIGTFLPHPQSSSYPWHLRPSQSFGAGSGGIQKVEGELGDYKISQHVHIYEGKARYKLKIIHTNLETNVYQAWNSVNCLKKCLQIYCILSIFFNLFICNQYSCCCKTARLWRLYI